MLHLVLYSNGEPFDTTKKLMIQSIDKYTKRKVMIHDYTLKKIKKKTMVLFYKRSAVYP